MPVECKDYIATIRNKLVSKGDFFDLCRQSSLRFPEPGGRTPAVPAGRRASEAIPPAQGFAPARSAAAPPFPSFPFPFLLPGRSTKPPAPQPGWPGPRSSTGLGARGKRLRPPPRAAGAATGRRRRTGDPERTAPVSRIKSPCLFSSCRIVLIDLFSPRKSLSFPPPSPHTDVLGFFSQSGSALQKTTASGGICPF